MSREPRYKNTGMNSFYGQYLYARIVPQDHFVRALKELFDWQMLGERLIDLYVGQGLYGRPLYNPVLVFKMLFLSYLYGLSERDTERWVNENIPARFFLDLAVDERAPDHSTLTVFKDRLLQAGNWQVLSGMFDGVLMQDRGHGLRFGHIQLVDSVHTQADVNNQKDRERQDKGKPPRDPQARVVHKGKREVVEADGRKVTKEIRYRGYKTHVSVDAKTRVPTSVLPTMGDAADNKAFAQLFAHDLSLHLPTTTPTRR